VEHGFQGDEDVAQLLLPLDPVLPLQEASDKGCAGRGEDVKVFDNIFGDVHLHGAYCDVKLFFIFYFVLMFISKDVLVWEYLSANVVTRETPTFPLFSGWNCVATT
jgi:hypothetical protein